MSWPTPQEFNEAIQNHQQTLGDTELRSGVPELTPLGLPRPISGMFATVYRIENGSRSWAVRCFQREILDLGERYEAISAHLNAHKVPYAVDFDYLPQGIRIRGQWYPILKMEWVQGETLVSFIEQHLNDPKSLLDLAGQLLGMVESLQNAKIAHGDLQHGNIIVVQGHLRLVDYDGMYVPALQGRLSHEVGHRNYQHPLRSSQHFMSSIDNFSTWVIYLSLLALSIDPDLWKRYNGGDECLLFRQQDFADPSRSTLLRSLQQNKDKRIQSAAVLFTSLLQFDPSTIPSPSELFDNSLQSQPQVKLGITQGNSQAHGLDWLKDHLGNESTPTGTSFLAPSKPQVPSPAKNSTVSPPDLSWILDALFLQKSSLQPIFFESNLFVERLSLSLSAIAIVFLVVAVVYFGMTMATVTSSLVVIFVTNFTLTMLRYRMDSARGQYQLALKDVRIQDDRARKLADTILRLEKKTRSLEQKKQKKIAKVSKKKAKRVSLEQGELKKKDNESKKDLNLITNRKISTSQQRDKELHKIQRTIGKEISRLSHELQSLNQNQTNELNRLLQSAQKNHVQNSLRSKSIDSGDIYGVGPNLKMRLKQAGIYTAADISSSRVQRVYGIGPQKAATLQRWRQSVESLAQSTIPQKLTSAEVDQVRARWTSKKNQLEAEILPMQKKQADEEKAIQTRYGQAISKVTQEEQIALNKHQSQKKVIQDRYAPDYVPFDEAIAELHREYQRELNKIDQQIIELRKEQIQILWKQQKMVRQTELLFSNISYLNYLQRIISG